MRTLWTILLRPRATARTLRERPRWLIPFLLLSAGHVIMLVAGEAAATRAAIAHLPPGATSMDKTEVAAMLSGELPVRALFEPIRLLAGWSTFAGILYLLTSLLKPPEPVPFIRLLALEVHAESVLLLAAVSSLVSPSLAGPSPGFQALTPPFSAAWLLPASASFPLFSLLGTVHIFTLWYAVILTIGIGELCGMSLRKAAAITAGAWTISVLWDVGIITLLIDRLHFLV